MTLCYHVAAKRLKKFPDEYAECFAILAEAGLISGGLAERLQQMARFRNLLVHLYWKLDYRRVFQVLRNDLGDLRDFAASMIALLS